MTGSYRPTEASIEIWGEAPSELSPAQKRKIGYLPQLAALLPELSIRENLQFQAQYATLFLLTSLFFGGFFLDLDSLRYPFKAVSWALPITDAIRALQDVRLRGQPPADQDLMGLGAITAVAAFLAWLLMRRQPVPSSWS